ncbi:MAG: CDP-archaeol synthase [Pseudomonadota bacterium]
MRAASGVALGLAVLALTWVGGTAFDILAVAVMALVFFEWFRIVATDSLSRLSWTIGYCTIGVVGLCILAGLSAFGVGATATGAVALLFVRIVEKGDFWPSIGLIYAGFFGVAFAALRDSAEFGFALIIFIFAVIWTTDVSAFFGGRRFGGPKLAPVVSPNKTWSGFLSGLVGGILAGVIAATILTASSVRWVAVLAALVSIAGQMGDLFESGFKRRYGVKDSGALIPGHGGVMDRLDSVIFATFVAYLVAIAMPEQKGLSGGGNGIALHLLGS